MNSVNEFTFCVLTYNHSKYILIHLESIKYQVIYYGKDIKCNLILTNDNSTDDTIHKIEKWLDINRIYFNDIKIINNKINKGTCYCTSIILENLESKYFKLTAGDDYYTSTNIFDIVSSFNQEDLYTTVPIRMKNNELYISYFEVFNFLLSHYVYKNTTLLKRLSRVSIINAPNLFYSYKHIKNTNTLNFLKQFDVVEDFALQIAISRDDKNVNLQSILSPLVIYRRTSNSTYLTHNSRFVNDQKRLLNYLEQINKENKNKFDCLLIRYKAYLLNNNTFLFKYFFNPLYILFFFKSLIFIPIAIVKMFQINFNIKIRKNHYSFLLKSVQDYD